MPKSTSRYTATLKLEIDLDLYPVPSDGKIKEQLSQDIKDALYELDGIKINSINVTGRDLMDDYT